jgi:hypothetical protein
MTMSISWAPAATDSSISRKRVSKGVKPAGKPVDTKAQQLAEKKLNREFEMVQRDVTLGRWPQVGTFLATMPEKERVGCYEHLLRTLPNHPQRPEDQRIPPNLQERNAFSFSDLFAIAAIAPGGFDKKQVPMLAPLVQRAIETGNVLEELVRQLGEECKKPVAEQRIDRREAAILLSSIGQEIEMGAFLPSASEAETANDREALNLLARHALAMYAKEKRTAFLQTAWQVTQAALASAMAEIARLSPDPKPLLGDSVARLLGFADAAASGLRDQPRVNAQAPTTAALRMADWAEGLLCANQGGSQGGKQGLGKTGG